MAQPRGIGRGKAPTSVGRRFLPGVVNTAGRLSHGAAFHGKVTPEYRAWCGMKTRCYNPNRSDFGRYGGRGIRVAEEWRTDFMAFLAHVGPRPGSEYSLDRIDVDGDYTPGNVRWATRSEQRRNRRDSRAA